MRAFSGILLGFIILFNLAGLPVVFKCQQLRIRREMKGQIKAGIPKKQLHHLAFSGADIDDLQWTEKDKEFIFENEMYDIVSSKEENGVVHFYCINDKEEKSLLDKLNDLVGRKLKDDLRSGKNVTGKLIRAISSLIFIDPGAAPSIALINNDLSHHTIFNCKLSAPYLEFDSPPPRFS